MYSFSLQELAMLAGGLARLQYRPQQEWLLLFLHAVHLQLKPFAVAAAGAAQHHTAAGSSGPAGASGSHHVLSALDAVSSSGGRSASAMDSGPLPQQLQQQQQQPVDAAARASAARGLVAVLWVLGVWHAQVPAEWRSCCLAAAEQLVGCFSSQGLATLLWALGKLQVGVLVCATCCKRRSLSPSCITDTTPPVCASPLQVQPPETLLAALLRRSRALLPAANATDLAMLAWGLGTAGVTAAATAASAGASSSSSSAGSRQRPSGWLARFLRSSYRALPGASTADVATLLVGLARMRIVPGGWGLAGLWHSGAMQRVRV
jgi:sulfur relay (sulfurtransferase) complex TusBCD TusD component (DsrE family)